jgi:hypothetical protein
VPVDGALFNEGDAISQSSRCGQHEANQQGVLFCIGVCLNGSCDGVLYRAGNGVAFDSISL